MIRTLDEPAMSTWDALSSTRFFAELTAAEKVIASRKIPLEETDLAGSAWAGALEHQAIPFISYPYEWPFSMLKDAALLTLDILAAGLPEDFILKDATPYNVQWRGTQPTFIDIGSFERLKQGEAWTGYRQFCRMFLFPLMMQAYKDLPFAPWLRGRLDGIAATEFRGMLGSRDLLRRGVMLHTALQARAERRYQNSEQNVREVMREAGFRKELIENNIGGLRKTVAGLSPARRTSAWMDYPDQAHVQANRDQKADFLVRTLGNPSLVWDLGANDGHFSRLAAGRGAYVVAADADEAVVDALYRTLVSEESRKILPLVLDVTDPSPATGWRQSERTPFEHRGKPELVILYAIIHHMVIGGNIPVREVVEWLAELGSRIIIEFVPLEDPLTARLVANKRADDVHRDYTEEAFRRQVSRFFEIELEEPVADSQRRLFSLRPRD